MGGLPSASPAVFEGSSLTKKTLPATLHEIEDFVSPFVVSRHMNQYKLVCCLL